MASSTPAVPVRPESGSRRDVLRRVLVVGAVLLAIGLFVLAGFAADTGSPSADVSGDFVERLEPAPGTEAFGQQPIQLDLAPGWALASLTVNGTTVPESEWTVTPELNLYQFLPADGKSVEEYAAQRNDVRAEVFPVQDPADLRPVSWSFDSL